METKTKWRIDNSNWSSPGVLTLIILTLFSFQSCKSPSGKEDTVEAKVNNLLSQMTLEEKVDLVGGLGFKTKENKRLGIPEIVMSDGGIGPNRAGKSTNYSATINLAATFDTRLMRQVAENMGEETHIAKSGMLLAPMVNIIRTPFGGRAFELFSEDPYLTSRMCVEFVKGVQSKNIMTCTKVIAVNNQEWNRFDVDVKVSERALQEIYLPAIKAAVQEADTWSVMAAYNSINGDYGCENKHLLTDILKNEWGFTGAVVSDWGGAHSTVKMANSGLDLEMPMALFYGDKLLNAIKENQVDEKVLDDKVRRLLRIMFKAKMFEKTNIDYGPSDTPERRALALETAQKSIVLLKNKNNFLPLKKENFKSVAVIGPNGDVAQMSGGGSGFLEGNYWISPFDGITARTKGNASVIFERGITLERTVLPVAGPECYYLPDGNPGIKAEYFNNRDLQGKPVLSRTEKLIDYDWGFGDGSDPGKLGSPDPKIVKLNQWSARWTGKFKSPGDGWYEIGVAADNGVRLYLNGKMILDCWVDSRPSKFKMAQVELKAGQLYDLKVEFYENMGSCLCKLGIAPFDKGNKLESAVELAKKNDLVVLCLGLNKELEGESTDREELALPAKQLELLNEIVKANPNTMVVLNNATPILMADWIDKVPAVIEAFYPGQEGGNALADILFGDVNPSGKLPITLMKRWEDSSAFGTYPGTKTIADYKEGIFVGYRHFDKENIEPQFPFGFGLSYTTFEYSGMKLDKPVMEQNDTLTISMTVKNTGQMDGDEIVQLYIHDDEASVEREVKSLKGFKRVNLKAGESKEVAFKINKTALSFYDEKSNKWLAEPGQFDVLLGSSSRDIRLKQQFLLK
ncbi:MAG: glycoside hydrolase family 3 C-terminal domain-containing protein [Bacteroidota bacterium]|nr:glycoside hydrolase family 3 C-terminal domain-containing protein [Bacteroidota bacterium]